MKKQIPPKKKRTFLKLGLLIIGIVGSVLILNLLSGYIYINPDLKKIHPVVCVAGKTLYEIKQEYPIKYDGLYKNNMEIYSFFEHDSLARIMFFFSGGVCGGQVIIPRDNKIVELYLHYLNKNGLDYTKGDKFFDDGQGSKPNPVLHVSGRWRIFENGKSTNVFLVAGEEDKNGEPKAIYFVNTPLQLSEAPF